MSCLTKHHTELINGVGKCSVPMWWANGLPAGFCDNDAYSEQTEKDKEWRKLSNNFLFVPALACEHHGGMKKEEALHLCQYCLNEFATCKSNPKFGSGLGNDNVYECDIFNPKSGAVK